MTTKSPKRTKPGLGNVPEIVQVGHPALHSVAKEVPIENINSAAIQKVIADMKAALNSQDDGIGLAAPQIGVSLRIFMVSGKVLLPPSDRILATEGKKPKKEIPNDLVFINPILVKESKEKKWLDGEGCLSVRWLYGKVRRSTKVSVRAYDENGNLFERGAGGLMAHIFQHEIDHLNGILFIDKAKDVQELERDTGKTQGSNDNHIDSASTEIDTNTAGNKS